MPEGNDKREARRRLESLRAPGGLAAHATLDTLGLYCPLPIVRTSQKISGMPSGEVLEVLSDDRVVLVDMPAWCLSTGNEYLGFREEHDHWRLYVRRK